MSDSKEPSSLPEMTPDKEQLRALDKEQLRALDKEQLKALDKEQLKALDKKQLKALDKKQLKALDKEQLKALLTPTSIAVLGASQRKESVGNEVLVNLLAGKYAGLLFPINPRYETIDTLSCYPSLNDLPLTVDHVILAVGDERIEAAFESVIAHGAKACTIFTSLVLDSDEEPNLKERIKSAAEDAGILLIGGNGMGYYNFTEHVRICGFETRHHSDMGNVTLISQSGSGMAGILDVEERINFNFAASTGQELIIGLEDLLEYTLDQPSTRVVGLFMETCRKPDVLIRALEKAKDKRIPIVVIKVGKSDLAARLAISHSGALAGQDAVFDAIFDKYGIHRVDDMNQLTTALIMFSQPHTVALGGLATIHDSGGERQLLADLAVEHDVRLAILNEHSTSSLNEILDPGLPGINPLDAWGRGGPDSSDIMKDSFGLLMSDPDTALGAVVMDRGPNGVIYEQYLDYLLAGHEGVADEALKKPAFLVANHQGVGTDPMALEITRAGFPVLDNLTSFLVGARCLMRHRDYIAQETSSPPVLNEVTRNKWRQYFESNPSGDPAVSELTATRWLDECGIPMSVPQAVSSVTELQSKTADLTFPVVLKTAETGISHKSDVGGVVLDIKTPQALDLAYREIAARLGPKAIISSMITEPGLEMILGLVQDPGFGPVVVMGLGGTRTELLNDVVMVLPPFDTRMAKRALEKLKHSYLFKRPKTEDDENSSRNAIRHPVYDMDSFAQTAALFSAIAAEFSDIISELDINPIKVLERGCIGLDALLVRKQP